MAKKKKKLPGRNYKELLSKEFYNETPVPFYNHVLGYVLNVKYKTTPIDTYNVKLNTSLPCL